MAGAGGDCAPHAAPSRASIDAILNRVRAFITRYLISTLSQQLARGVARTRTAMTSVPWATFTAKALRRGYSIPDSTYRASWRLRNAPCRAHQTVGPSVARLQPAAAGAVLPERNFVRRKSIQSNRRRVADPLILLAASRQRVPHLAFLARVGTTDALVESLKADSGTNTHASERGESRVRVKPPTPNLTLFAASYPPLQKTQERGTHTMGRSSKSKVELGTPQRWATRLTETEPGSRWIVTSVYERDRNLLEFFDKEGIRPGVRVAMAGRNCDGTLSLSVDKCQIRLGTSVADKIWVSKA